MEPFCAASVLSVFDLSMFLVVNFWNHLTLLTADDNRLSGCFTKVVCVLSSPL